MSDKVFFVSQPAAFATGSLASLVYALLFLAALLSERFKLLESGVCMMRSRLILKL